MSDEDEAKYSMDSPGMSVSAAPGGLASAANPYHVNFDRLKLQGVSGSGGSDYVFPEEHGDDTHDWSASIFWGTGLAFLTGSIAGGAWGVTEGLRNKEGQLSRQLRLNSVLNASGRRGPLVGNRMGILAFFYTFTDGAMIKLRNGENDLANKLGAGIITGAIFSSASGPRQAAVSAVAGGVLAGVGVMVHSLLGGVSESVYEPEYR